MSAEVEPEIISIWWKRIEDEFSRHLKTHQDTPIQALSRLEPSRILLEKPCRIISICDIEQNFEHAGVIASQLTREEYEILPSTIKQLLAKFKRDVFVAQADSGSRRIDGDNRNLVFTGNLYLFTDQLIVPEEEIRAFFHQNQMKLILRDEATWQSMWKNRRYDGYLIHDSRDKKSFVKPLYDALTKRLAKIWYDETALEVGDDLAEKIEKGLQSSNYAILVVSDNFIKNESWAKKEFEKVKERQLKTGKKLILPVWYKIRSRKVVRYSEWLGTKVAASDEKVEKIADRLLRVLKHHL